MTHHGWWGRVDLYLTPPDIRAELGTGSLADGRLVNAKTRSGDRSRQTEPGVALVTRLSH